MLQTLSIKNVALITDLTIEFNSGLNILLGETGAGKSIIFDSLNFVLGGKADKTLIRTGEKEMRVDAIFCNLSDTIQANLEQLGFEGDELNISRTLSEDGRSTIRINGIPSIQTILKSVGQILVDSYSQHESVQLMKTKNHLAMLDRFGGEAIYILKIEVQELFNQEKETEKQIKELGGNEFERERMKSLLEYQINELEEAKLVLGEDEQLQEKLKFMQSAEKIHEILSECEELLNNNSSSCLKSLHQSVSMLGSLSSFTDILECKERLESARYEIEDINQTLKDIKSSTDYDEREFDLLDRRLDTIKSITKKYGGTIEKSLEFLSEAKENYNKLVDSDCLLQKLEKERSLIKTRLFEKSSTLSKLRKDTARVIEIKLSEELKQLGMKSSKFEIKFEELSDVSSLGFDSVEFVFSANKGQELKALSKTASGGELSRFMLAFKTIFSQSVDTQTLVFDEIDSGISGETGNIVGQKLNNISQSTQVLCITHLPQVACYADSMYFVSKRETDNSTHTEIKNLEGEEIVLNLAKMVVGDNVSSAALMQAKEMRMNAKKKV